MGICSANCGHVKAEEITLAETVKEKGYRRGILVNGTWELSPETFSMPIEVVKKKTICQVCNLKN
jgi:hypothetical protein